MSVQTTTKLTDLPKVNLLPPEIAEQKRLQQVQAAVVLGIVVSLAGVGYLYVEGNHKVDSAKQQVTAATQQNQALTQQLAKYNNVKATAAQLAASQALIGQAMATEVKWSEYLADFSTTLPATTWLTSLTLSESVAAGSIPAPAQAPAELGTVAAQGFALHYGDLADWLDSLGPVKGLSGSYFSQATEQYIGKTKVVNFQGTVNLTSAALSGGCTGSGSC